MNFLADILAQTSQSPPTNQPSAGQYFPIALMLAVVVFWILSMRSQKKREQREKDDMHARLAKNDRVQTIGGIIGTVHSVKDDAVVVKVDESTNTKMTFLKSSIQRIMSDDRDTPRSNR